MLLAVDIGNTRAKAAVFENDTLKQVFVFTKESAENTLSEIATLFNIEAVICSSVGGWMPEFGTHFTNSEIFSVNADSKMPFENLYSTPKTLGVDRIVLSAGATLSFPEKNRLVIDAGTCITYDFINDQNQYLGGAISPGLRLRYESLHNFTAKLPLLEKSWPENFIGASTSESIHSGVVNGCVCEIDGIVSHYAENHPNFIIILTGGDSDFLAKRLKNTIFANSNFLLESLNKLYQYQISHD